MGHFLCFGWRSHTRTLALLAGLGEKRTEDLHDLGGTALGTLGPFLPVLRNCLHAGESFTALLAAILISRHSADTSTSDFVHQGPYAASPLRNHQAQPASVDLALQEQVRTRRERRHGGFSSRDLRSARCEAKGVLQALQGGRETV